jgi:hypothetical protein
MFMHARQLLGVSAMGCACWLALAGASGCKDEDGNLSATGDSGAADACAYGTNTPGSQCGSKVRFEFDAGAVDIEGDLAKKGIEMTVPDPKEGFQFTTQGIRLESGEDDEWCEAFEVPEVEGLAKDEDFCVTRFEVAMTKGFHHLFVAKAPIGSDSEALMEVGKRTRCVGGAHVAYGTDLIPIPLPQGEYVDAPYWPGVAMRMRAGQKISVNYHYLDVSDNDVIGVTKLNFHAQKCDNMVDMQQFGFYNQDISVPAGGSQSTEMAATFNQDVYVLDIFRHTHRHGGHMPITFYKGPKDGELIYDSPNYEEGASFRFPEPVLVKKGEGFKFVCNYENPTERAIRFGPTANDEMCMLLGTWWVANEGEAPKIQHRYKWPK